MFKFFRRERINETPQDVARRLSQQIEDMPDKDEIAYYFIRALYPGKHIHTNPRKKEA